MKIFEESKEYSNVENEIIRKINEDPLLFLSSDLISYSKIINCSKSAISRLVKILNFDSLISMKLHVKEKVTLNHFFFNIKGNETTIERINNIKSYNNFAINMTIENISIDKLNNLTDRIINSKRIHIFGIGASYLAAYELTNNLLKIGFSVSCSSDIHNTMLTLSSMSKDDTLILLSKSGETKEMVFFKDQFETFKFEIIVVTSNEKFASNFKYKLIQQDIEKKDRLIATSSKISQLVLVDIIFYEVYFKKNKEIKSIENSVNFLKKWKEYK